MKITDPLFFPFPVSFPTPHFITVPLTSSLRLTTQGMGLGTHSKYDFAYRPQKRRLTLRLLHSSCNRVLRALVSHLKSGGHIHFSTHPMGVNRMSPATIDTTKTPSNTTRLKIKIVSVTENIPFFDSSALILYISLVRKFQHYA